MIGVGMMDKRITIGEYSVAADDKFGGVTSKNWEYGSTIWAHVVWRGGKIESDGDQMQVNQTIEFYIRNGGTARAMTVQSRIAYDDAIFYIDAIDVIDGREKYLRIITTQVQPANLV